jgi:hypothetical protein
VNRLPLALPVALLGVLPITWIVGRESSEVVTTVLVMEWLS